MTPLGMICDEVSDDFDRACERIRAWGLAHLELRQAWGKNVVQWSDAEVERAADAVARHGLGVTAVASPVFKSPLDERPREMSADFALEGVESMDAQLDLLERACWLADRFDAPMVRVFSFWREPWSEAVARTLVGRVERAARVAQRFGVTLAVENEPVCIVGTGRELGRACSALDAALPSELRPHVGALWDPGNALSAGERDPYPDGYEALSSCRLVHVHLKDLVWNDDGTPSFVPLGEGRVDYAGQLARLEADGYRGAVVLEPHYAPPHLSREDAAHACVRAAQAALAAASS